ARGRACPTVCRARWCGRNVVRRRRRRRRTTGGVQRLLGKPRTRRDTPAMTTATSKPVETKRPSANRAVFFVLVILVLLLCAAVIAKLSTGAPQPPSANIGTQLDATLPTNIASLPLVDEYGHETNLAAFKGKTV